MNEYNAIVSKRIDLAPGLMIMHVAPKGWPIPQYTPGQFTVLGLPGTYPRHPSSVAEKEPIKPGNETKLLRRAYSLASTPHYSDELEFYITMVNDGGLTPRLFQLNMGDPIYVGPKITGHFTLAGIPPEANVVLVSTGTGLAPFVSMVRTDLAHFPKRKWMILHGVRHSWELAYRDELSAYTRLFPNFSYISTVSRPADEKFDWRGRTGYVQDIWKQKVIQHVWGQDVTPANTHFFFCGNPAMIATFSGLLHADGFVDHTNKVPGQIHSEKYW